jgi:hypothetical protein
MIIFSALLNHQKFANTIRKPIVPWLHYNQERCSVIGPAARPRL